MTVGEIYSKIIQHSIYGLMLHAQLADYYLFLGLDGYSKRHEYHYMSESKSFRCISRYCISHHDTLVPELRVDDPKIIPESWYKYTRQDVDSNTIMSAVENGAEKWVEWETTTKKLYEKMYSALIEIDEVASAMKVKMLICDVDKELKSAEKHHLKLKAVKYSLDYIISEQSDLHKKYKEKIEHIYDEH